MKKRLMVAVAVTCLCVSLLGISFAGIEPSPFKPTINKLDSIAKILDAIAARIVKVMASLPDESEPSINVIGAVNRLNATINQGWVLNQFVLSEYNEFLLIANTEQQTDGWFDDVLPSLYDIKGELLGVEDAISTYPDEDSSAWEEPEFRDALLAVQYVFQGIADNTQKFIDTVRCEPAPDIVEEAVCVELPYDCIWVADGPAEPYCCCIPLEPPVDCSIQTTPDACYDISGKL